MIDKWLSQSTDIHDQSLYYLRQEYFKAEKEHRKPDYKKIKLYDLVKETEAWKSSDLDFNAKQYAIRKVANNWVSFHKACKAYWKDKSKFKGKPKLPNYLIKRGKSSVLIFDKNTNPPMKNSADLIQSFFKNMIDNFENLPIIDATI